jgi:hypothetical protein
MKSRTSMLSRQRVPVKPRQAFPFMACLLGTVRPFQKLTTTTLYRPAGRIQPGAMAAMLPPCVSP